MTTKKSQERPAPLSLQQDSPSLDRATELRELYDDLKIHLRDAQGSGVAAIGRELRILAKELEQIEAQEVSKVDELAIRRKTKAGPKRQAARRSKSR